MSSNTTIAGCIPYFDCIDYIDQAVRSLLNQTKPLDEIYIVCDGDSSPPWHLPTMNDPRIRKIELDTSMGPFFAVDLVMRTTACDFVLLQDADDWSSPSRAHLLQREILARPQLIAATSAQLLHEDDLIEYESLSNRLGRPISSDTMMDRFRHHGLYNRREMLSSGGYFGGFKFAFDAYLTGMLYVTNRVSVINPPLYNRRLRKGSLTRSDNTGMGSPNRTKIATQLRAMVADLTGLQQPITSGHIARVTARFLGNEPAVSRDVVATKLRSADWHRPERVSVPKSLREALIQ